MSNNKLTIGLFGSTGSDWRKDFITRYQHLKIPYFNPSKDDWTPLDASNEANHLQNDDIILIPVLNTSYGLASLSEIGFASIRAINENKSLIVLIDDKVDSDLGNDELITLSNNTRAIIKQHVIALSEKYPQIIIANSLNDLLDVSIELAFANNDTTKLNRNSSSFISSFTSAFIRQSEQKLKRNLRTDPNKDERLRTQQCRRCFYTTAFGGAAITTSKCDNCGKEMTFGSTNVDVFCMDCAIKLNSCIHCGNDVN